MIFLQKNELKLLKDEILKNSDNCIIYNYYDLKHHKNLIKDKINKLKFIKQIKLNARDCIIKIINNDDKNNFLNENHIQGTDRSQIYYGAYINNDLISVICFDGIRAMNGGIDKNEYELSRFAIKSGFIIVGIFNRLLKKFIEDYKPNKIISFADLNQVNRNNNIYEYSGFKTIKNIPPDYKFLSLDKDKLFHKFTFGNKFMKNENIEINQKKIITKNLHKVWNCGKIKYCIYFNNGNVVFGFIYQINNKINNKKYIGQTIRPLNKRIYEYKAAFKYQNFYNQHLLSAFNKYGFENFQFSIIDTATTLDELNKKEIKYIEEYKSNNKEFGYNIEFGGKNAIPDIETLDKMSKSHLGIVQSDEWINRRIAKAGSKDAKKYGKEKTEEEKLNLSIKSPRYWQGKNRDEETKKKISKTKKENGLSEKQKEIICKKVYLVDLNVNKIIEMFESTAQAANVKKVNQSTISRWCSKNKIIDNILWKY